MAIPFLPWWLDLPLRLWLGCVLVILLARWVVGPDLFIDNSPGQQRWGPFVAFVSICALIAAVIGRLAVIAFFGFGALCTVMLFGGIIYIYFG